MAERASPVTRLPARPIDEILDELVALRRRGGDAETPAPLVTLHFRSGRSLSGRVIDRVASPRAALLVQVVAGRDDGDALYVDPGAIEALQVHDAAAVASLLSDGKVASAAQPRPDLGQPPSRLDLKRRLASDGETLGALLGRAIAVEADWDHAPAAGEPLRALATLAELVLSVLLELGGAADGREALLAQVTRVRLCDGAEGVLLDGGTLTVSARLDFGASGRLGREVLRAAIERLL